MFQMEIVPLAETGREWVLLVGGRTSVMSVVSKRWLGRIHSPGWIGYGVNEG